MDKKCIVFVAKDGDEYKRYPKPSPRNGIKVGYYNCSCSFLAGNTKVPDLLILESFHERDVLAKALDSNSITDNLLIEYCIRIAGAINCCFTPLSIEDYLNNVNVYVFTHWGGGTKKTILDMEKVINDTNENIKNTAEDSKYLFQNWYFYSLSTEYPEIIDLKRDKIELPIGNDLARFLKKIEDKKKENVNDIIEKLIKLRWEIDISDQRDKKMKAPENIIKFRELRIIPDSEDKK